MKENYFANNHASGNRTDFAGEVPAGPGDSGNISVPHREPVAAQPASTGNRQVALVSVTVYRTPTEHRSALEFCSLSPEPGGHDGRRSDP